MKRVPVNIDDLLLLVWIDGMNPGQKAAVELLRIQKNPRLTVEETAAQIHENPYLQYFLGYENFSHEKPFGSSMTVYFRKRVNLEELSAIDELIHSEHRKQSGSSKDKDKKDKGRPSGGSENQGKLIVDSSCAPADIRNQIDLSLLSEAREKCEHFIDRLHEPLRGEEKMVRTDRNKARRDHLNEGKGRQELVWTH